MGLASHCSTTVLHVIWAVSHDAGSNNQLPIMPCNITHSAQLIPFCGTQWHGTWSLVGKARLDSVGMISMLVYCIALTITRLDVPARAIFSSPAVFKREALTVRCRLRHTEPFRRDRSTAGQTISYQMPRLTTSRGQKETDNKQCVKSETNCCSRCLLLSRLLMLRTIDLLS